MYLIYLLRAVSRYLFRSQLAPQTDMFARTAGVLRQILIRDSPEASCKITSSVEFLLTTRFEWCAGDKSRRILFWTSIPVPGPGLRMFPYHVTRPTVLTKEPRNISVPLLMLIQKYVISFKENPSVQQIVFLSWS